MSKEFIKPESPLIGADGNIFNLIAIASRSLNENNYSVEAKEMTKRVIQSSSYEEALGIINEYVEPVNVYEYEISQRDYIDYE